MRKLREVGVPLADYAGVKPFYGIKTGLNGAFLIDGATRNALVAEDPKSAEILKPYLRGQDIERWVPNWSGLWMIFARRGIDIEGYPAVLRHLQKFRERLEPRPADWTRRSWPGRKPGNYKWYEIQDTVAYWELFEAPKIFYQEIQFYPVFALDRGSLYSNNKTFVLPVQDYYLLAVLNSPLMWWHNWRFLSHMKDEALTPAGYKMEILPVADPPAELKENVVARARRVVEIRGRSQEARSTLFDWLRIEHGLEKPSRRLQQPFELDTNSFVAEVRKLRGRKNPLSAAALKNLRDEHATTIEPVQKLLNEGAALERELSDLVNAAFGLTPEEVDLMWRTAPPRMPLSPP